jgi:hypothetical protein
MTAYVEECRREWKRLGVPELLAEEMATELESDLAEAEADGVSADEILGESDPRRFAATWAKERGLVREPQPTKTKRRRRWPWVVVGLVLALVFVIVLALVAAAGVSVHTHVNLRQPQAVRSVVIPDFVGLKACHAKRIALESGLKVRRFSRGRCDALVIAQTPSNGTLIEWPRGAHATVILRLRG